MHPGMLCIVFRSVGAKDWRVSSAPAIGADQLKHIDVEYAEIERDRGRIDEFCRSVAARLAPHPCTPVGEMKRLSVAPCEVAPFHANDEIVSRIVVKVGFLTRRARREQEREWQGKDEWRSQLSRSDR